MINGQPAEVRDRFNAVVHSGETILTSSIVVFELWYGVAKSVRQDANEALLSAFLAGPVEILDFDEEDAHVAGDVRARLRVAGTPIGAYDLLIAAQGLRRQAIVVTANRSEFSRVPDLKWEDWASD